MYENCLAAIPTKQAFLLGLDALKKAKELRT